MTNRTGRTTGEAPRAGGRKDGAIGISAPLRLGGDGAPRPHTIGLLLIALLAAALASARPAWACTEPPGGLPTFTAAERAAQAQLVLHGEVVALADQPSGIPGETATIRVREYLKGSGPAELTIKGYGPGSLCRAELLVGDERIFFAMSDGAGGWQAFYLSQFDAVAPATQTLIDEIVAATGEEPRPPDAAPGEVPTAPGAGAAVPSEGATAPIPSATSATPLLLAALALIMGVSAALWLRRRGG